MTWNFDDAVQAYKSTSIPMLKGAGYIKLIDVSGSDALIAKAARVSRNNQNLQTSEEDDATLIDNLMRWKHTTPFEFASITIEVMCPIFIARQWFRHRTFTYMERSGRYSTTPCEYYVSDRLSWLPSLDDFSRLLSATYTEGTDEIPNEDLRAILPLGTYTTFWCKADLHNLFHFLKLRLDKAAQKEIREYANGVYTIVKALFPQSARAFDKYVLNAVELTRDEANAIKKLLKKCEPITNESVNNVVGEVLPENATDKAKQQVVKSIKKFVE